MLTSNYVAEYSLNISLVSSIITSTQLPNVNNKLKISLSPVFNLEKTISLAVVKLLPHKGYASIGTRLMQATF